MSFNNEECLFKSVCGISDTTDCNISCERFLEVDNLIKLSKCPVRHLKKVKLIAEECDIEAFQNLFKIKNNIKQFIDSGLNLIIYSDIVGNGKTTWAVKILIEYFKNIWNGNGFRCRGLFYNSSKLFEVLRDYNNNNKSDESSLMKDLETCDLLVIDDIGATKFSDFRGEVLFSILEARLNNNKSCIFTTNYNNDRMLSVLDARIVSRIWNTSIIIELKGSEKRGITNG